MENFKVIIEVEGDKTKMSFSDPAPTFEDLLSGIFSNVLGVMNAAVERAPDEHKEEAKGQLYDCFNMAASSVEPERGRPEMKWNVCGMRLKRLADRMRMGLQHISRFRLTLALWLDLFFPPENKPRQNLPMSSGLA